MARETYEACLARLKVHEGGYTNHPDDPGGPTNFGITIADYRRYVKPRATAADVKAMTWDEAKAIYRARYWDAQRCDDLPAGVDDSIFDYGVNSGIGRSAKVLQRLVGVKDDGRIGPATLAAVAQRDAKQLVAAIADERLRFLKSLKTWDVFGKGWGRRVAEVKAFSLQLAVRATPLPTFPTPGPPAPQAEVQTAGKGVVPQPVSAREATIVGGGGAAVAGGGGFGPWLAAHHFEAGLIVLAGIVVIGCVIYLIDRAHRARQEAPMPATPVVPVVS